MNTRSTTVSSAPNISRALALLDLHADAAESVTDIAIQTGHPVPLDTRGWSQILVSLLSGVKGLERKKGADLRDGSDVKGASTWQAIDTPRFNGVIKAGTKAATSGNLESLDAMPHLYFVLWDHAPDSSAERCRVWVVRTQVDAAFREMCRLWYERREAGQIRSNNFQLHPPRNLNLNTVRNQCANLDYPLYFRADRAAGRRYELVHFDATLLTTGLCLPAQPAEVAAVPMDATPDEESIP